MSSADILQALLNGKRPENGLLHTCRLDALAISAYGEDAVAELMDLADAQFSDKATVLESAGHVAMADGGTALFADLAEGGIARIWLLSASDPWEGEPRVDVPHDPDLSQARGDVFFTASDHPDLEADAIGQLRVAGRILAREAGNPDWHDSRPRAFVIRAFGSEAAGAALFAVSRLAGGPMRRSGFTFALARWGGDGIHIVHDAAGQQALDRQDWTPRVSG